MAFSAGRITVSIRYEPVAPKERRRNVGLQLSSHSVLLVEIIPTHQAMWGTRESEIGTAQAADIIIIETVINKQA